MWYLVRWPWWWWFHCLTPAKAQQVFTAMAGTTCKPLTVPPPCIPFLYPEDGCWARADEMCRLMINMGFSGLRSVALPEAHNELNAAHLVEPGEEVRIAALERYPFERQEKAI